MVVIFDKIIFQKDGTEIETFCGIGPFGSNLVSLALTTVLKTPFPAKLNTYNQDKIRTS